MRARLERVLLELVARHPHLDSLRARQLDQPLDGLDRVLGPPVREDRDDLRLDRAHGSARLAAASSSATLPARPASAIQMKLSKLPAGPGRPDEA